jgi:hypothetical protein
MKKIILVIASVLVYGATHAQFVARMEVKDSDTLTGVCDRKNIYTMFSMFKGQEEAVCAVKDKDIEKRLNEEVQYLKSNKVKEDKGMVNIIISCEGDVVRCETDNKTKNEELDKQILAVFLSLKDWKPAKLNGKKVDSLLLYSYDIKNGKIELH